MTNLQAELIRTIQDDAYLGPMFRYQELLSRLKGADILDYGCGYGWGSYLMQPAAHSVTGYDRDAARVRFARDQLSGETGLSFTYDPSELAYKGYDLIILFHVLQSNSDVQELGGDLLRRLRPDGKILLCAKSIFLDKMEALMEYLKKNGGKCVELVKSPLSAGEDLYSAEFHFAFPVQTSHFERTARKAATRGCYVSDVNF